MISTLHLLILATFLMDMFLTYRYVGSYRKLYPESDWTLAEANPILRISMKHLGLEKGMFVGGGSILVILILTVGNFPYYYGWFLLGMYFMANTYHFVNYRAMKRLIKSKREW